MKISVIIPSHNRRHLLADALDSVRAQLRPADEVIVIDDRSNDGTAEFLRERYPEVARVRTEFGNAAAARHEGIERSSGDWLAFLDSDDRWEPHHLRDAESLLAGSDDVAYLGHPSFFTRTFSAKSNVPVPPLPIAEPTSGLSAEEYIRLFSRTRYFCFITVLLKKSRYFECGGFDTTQVRRHDIDLFLRAIRGSTWGYNPNEVACVRMGENDRITANRIDCEYFFLRSMKRCSELYPDNPDLRWLRRRASAVAAGSAGRSNNREALRRIFELSGPDLPLWRRAYWSLRILAKPKGGGA